MNKRLWLSGMSGMVGSHALRHVLLNTDWDVVGPVSFRHEGNNDRIAVAVGEWCDKHEECKPIDGWRSRLKVTTTDLTGPISESTIRNWGEVDYIWNVASNSAVPDSITDPVPFVRNNVELILAVLEYARVVNPEIFIQCSTDEVFGPVVPGQGHTEFEAYRPSNPYSASKSAQDMIAYSYYRSFDVPLLITHCMNMFSENQSPSKYTAMLIRKISNGETVGVHVDSEGRPGSRYYLHSRNLAAAWLWMTENKMAHRYSQKGGDPQKFNIAGNAEINNLAWAQMIAKIMGKPLKYELVNFHGGSHGNGHDPYYGLDSSKAEAAGWKLPVTLEESLERTIRWTLDHPSWL